MKNLFKKIAFLLIFIVLFTCSESINNEKTAFVTIKGIVHNYEKYKNDYAIVTAYVNDIIKASVTYPSFINRNGNFKIQFILDNSQDITLIYGNIGIPLFLKANDSLFIQIDADQLFETGVNNKSVIVDGISKDEMNLLISMMLTLEVPKSDE